MTPGWLPLAIALGIAPVAGLAAIGVRRRMTHRNRVRALVERRRPRSIRDRRGAVAGWTRRRFDSLLSGPAWRMACWTGALFAVAGAAGGGLVAGLAVGSYAVIGAVALHRRRSEQDRRRTRLDLLDRLVGLAADLRAGLPVTGAMSAAGLDPAGLRPAEAGAREGRASPDRATSRLVGLTTAAARLAERTGAPLADLVDRIESDARAGDRALAGAAAQAAGARATAMLLSGLPLGGIALGYGIGVDPLAVLLRTPLGAACVAGTVVLQGLGLVWTARLQPRPA